MATQEQFFATPETNQTPGSLACSAFDVELYNEATAPTFFNTQMILGRVATGKIWRNTGVYIRTMMTMPEGAIIDGVRIDIESFGSTGFFASNATGGLLKRDGIWDDADGFIGYATLATIPKPYADNGFTGNAAAWWGSTFAFDWTDDIDIDGTQPAGTDLSVGEGLASTYAAPGMIAKFQSYWDDDGNQAARTGGAIPVCWHMYTLAADSDYLASFKSGFGNTNPAISVLWHTAGGGPTGRGEVGVAVSGRALSLGAVSAGPGGLASAVEARTALGRAVSAQEGGGEIIRSVRARVKAR